MKRNLGVLVTEWNEIRRTEEDYHDDVSAWGAPSECHGDVSEQFDIIRKEFVVKNGFEDEGKFMKEIRNRTCAHYVHYNVM